MRPLLALAFAGAILGLAPGSALAQNICSPSTTAYSRYPAYPGSAPYTGASQQITSNCTGPAVDLGVTMDPYAGSSYVIPVSQIDGSILPPSGMAASPYGYAGAPGAFPPGGAAAGYAASPYPGAAPAYGSYAGYPGAAYPGAGYPALGSLAPAGYPGYPGTSGVTPYGAPPGYAPAGYGYPGMAPYAGYGAPGMAGYPSSAYPLTTNPAGYFGYPSQSVPSPYAYPGMGNYGFGYGYPSPYPVPYQPYP